MRHTVAVIVAAAGMILAAPAAAYDRPPFPMYGLTPDRWSQSITSAERDLRGRYPGIRAMFCQGVAMRGYSVSDWSFVHGLTRYWDKLICFGGTYNGHTFGLVYDSKGPHSWIIYRLKGAVVSDLE